MIGARFFSFVSDASIVPVFKRAMLVPGTVDGAAPDLDLAEPIFRLDHFIGQDTDFSPLYFDEPREIGDEVVEALDDGATHIFLVLELTDYFPGFSMLPPLIGLSQESPNGLSFFSDDGGATYTQVTTFDFAFQLVVKAPPGTGAASVGVPVILQR